MPADWERTIIFEGVDLPGCAIAIDHLGRSDNLPEMSEATSQWLWRFTICVGRPRSCDSKTICNHVGEALELTERFRERLVETVARHYDDTFTPKVIYDWLLTLRTILRIASSREECNWIAPLCPGEPNYGLAWPEIARDLADRLDKAMNPKHKR
jgi:hypothetical protein